MSSWEPTNPNHTKTRTRWFCAGCGEQIGKVYVTPGGNRMLKPTPALRLIYMSGPNTWNLICAEGHSTQWEGAGIRLEARQEAA
jgi:hypothetical protein